MKHGTGSRIGAAVFLSVLLALPLGAEPRSILGSGDIEGIGPPDALAYGGGVARFSSKASLKFKIRTVYGEDGNPAREILLMEDYAVDETAPKTLDRQTQIKYWVDGKGVPEVVLYGDKAAGTWRANGYRLAAPLTRPVVKVVFEPDKGKARIIWTDSQGKYKASYVTFLSKRGDTPPKSDAVLPVEDVDEGYAEAAGLKGGGNADPGGAATTLGGPVAGNGASGDPTAAKSATGSGIDLPGNQYGVDPVLTDEEIRKIVDQYVSEQQAKVKEPGYRMNDWGVLEAGHLKHEGKIDGFPTHVHFWVGTSGEVQGRLQAAAQEKRARLEAAAATKDAAGGVGTGPVSDTTPKDDGQGQIRQPATPSVPDKPDFPDTSKGNAGSEPSSEAYVK